ncbi:MAG: right-handed parallel beta-helix repeat-containing protein, partial [Planctomycetota bacterium]
GGVTVIKSTVSQNVAGGVRGSSVVLTGSTISGNLGTGVSGRTVRIVDSTITENVVAFAENDAGVRGTNVHVENSIIARNEGALSQLHAVDLFTSLPVEARNSLIGTNRGSQLLPTLSGLPDANGNLIGTLIQPIDPRLGPLANNGGPTLTHEPLPGSPVIDKGKSFESFDQRGLARTVNIDPAPNDFGVFVDIGAVERQTAPASWLPSDVSAEAGTTSDLNLSETLVSNDSGNPVTLTFIASRGQFEPPASGADVEAILVNPTTLSLIGLPLDINRYLDSTTNIQFTPQAGDIGNDVALLTAFLDDGTVNAELGEVNIDVEEPRSNMIVTTSSDELDRFDGDTSLREALLAAYLFEGTERITFEDELSGQSIFVSRPLDIVDSITIDATALSEMLTIDGQQTSQLFLADTALGTTLGDDLDVTIAGLRLVNGNSSEPGGAIGVFDFSSKLTLNSSVVDENRSDERGGGIYSVGEVVINDSLVSGNRGRYGGGIWVSGAATLSNSLVIDNVAFDPNCFCAGGGGISARYGAVITNSTISGNTSPYRGGGILSGYGELILQDSTVSQNRSAQYGGGIAANILIIANSTISHNEVTNGSGGGVRATRSYLTNSTVSGNSATVRGGGISGGLVSVAHSTVTNNSAGITGGGFAVNSYQPEAYVDHSIIFGNMAANDPDVSFSGPASINYSVIGPTDLTIIGTGNLIGVSPVLLPLVDNGGPTHTHALAPDSPAINAGNPTPVLPPEYDQRGPGFARVSGGRLDIGAFEFQEPRGDFNEDGVYDCLDIDALTDVLAMGLEDLRYDVTNDGVLDSADVEAWLAEAGSSLFGPGVSLIPGDADLNGTVDVSDWNIWNNNKFTMNSAWCSGNFNADTVIEVSDFNVWNENKFRSVSNPARQVDDEQLPVMSPDRTGLLSSQFAAQAVLYPGWHRLPFSHRVQWDAQHTRTRTLDMIFGDTPESRGVGKTAWYRRIGFHD